MQKGEQLAVKASIKASHTIKTWHHTEKLKQVCIKQNTFKHMGDKVDIKKAVKTEKVSNNSYWSS